MRLSGMIIDKGHFEIIIAGEQNCFDVYIYNKELNCSELYDDDMTEREVQNYLESMCDNCGQEVPEESFRWVSEDRGEFWGAPCSEMVCYGYKCPNCEHKEEF